MTAADVGTAARPVLVFVLGSGRSGTAALTRVLSLCGAASPAGMLGANSDNPRGYWEPRQAVYLNEVILRRNGSAHYDPSLRLQEHGALDPEEKAACVAEIGVFLAKLPAAPVVVIKDPRITLLTGVWFEAAHEAGFDVATVIAVRHPEEVNASVGAKTRVSQEFSSALWLKYLLLAERQTRGLPRVFVEYANLLEDWRREVKRISAALAIDLDTRDEAAIDEFVKPDLRRQRYSGPVTEPFGTDWMSTVYETLRAATRDESWDGAGLDRVFEVYRASERAFSTVFEDFHRFHKLNSVVPPLVWKLVNEVAAIAHRRRGTWA
ncbi:sulfotransferase family protein [Mycobacterium sp. 663a-19]|uniref:sulfotransferase family protein n=1 Tax=Mycobacterium sp. 663a-19 TaxID=2986148 RepID=UPI002D1EC07A|nr:sulfotransferase family protein [Mycobacterium sp. 663a-19]MEB3981997.1 sulfotransferase family protein [Mycobacterium sp. 663a-19]